MPPPQPLLTIPAGFVMGITETLPLGFDTTNLLGADQSPSNPVTVLTDTTTGDAITLPDAPTITGTVITQIVRGPTQLVVGHKFVLSWTFTAAVDTVWTENTIIFCQGVF